jgi:hypothetical protein
MAITSTILAQCLIEGLSPVDGNHTTRGER